MFIVSLFIKLFFGLYFRIIFLFKLIRNSKYYIKKESRDGIIKIPNHLSLLNVGNYPSASTFPQIMHFLANCKSFGIPFITISDPNSILFPAFKCISQDFNCNLFINGKPHNNKKNICDFSGIYLIG